MAGIRLECRAESRRDICLQLPFPAWLSRRARGLVAPPQSLGIHSLEVHQGMAIRPGQGLAPVEAPSSELDVAAGLAALLKISLVILLGAPERLRRFYFRDNLLRLVAAFGGQLFDLRSRLSFLIGRMIENRGSILGSPIGPLPVQRGGIVQREERIEQMLVRCFLRIEVKLHHFCMPGLVRANITIGWPFRRTALISDGSSRHARNRRKRSFHSPEASSTKGRFLQTHAN